MSATPLPPLLAAQLIAASKSGLFAEQVAIRCHISPDTLAYWLVLGMVPGAKEPYKSFAEDYAISDTDLEATLLRVVRRAARRRKAVKKVERAIRKTAEGSDEDTIEVSVQPADWKAAAWLLERRWPSRWGPVSNGNRAPDPTAALQLLPLIKQAASRSEDLKDVIDAMPPELEEALLANREKILALLAAPSELNPAGSEE